MAEIIRIEGASADMLAQVNRLLRQLTEHAENCTPELLETIVKSPAAELWVAKENSEIVGMATLAMVLKPDGIFARIEDLVVGESQRGKGIGNLLMTQLIARANFHHARHIELTSNSRRVAANKLYQKLGFTVRDTNVYRLRL